MKKTCYGCRAFERVPKDFGVYDKCSLGYYQYDSAPLEECPKPKTYNDLLEEKRIR